MAEVRRISAAAGGVEIPNTIAKVIRAVPFPPLNSLVGTDGESWVPVHGIVSLSTAPQVLADIQALFAQMAGAHQPAGIKTGFLFTSLSTNAIIIEPVFYWPNGWRPIHAAAIEPAHLARLTQRPGNPEATARVAEARKRVIAARENRDHALARLGHRAVALRIPGTSAARDARARSPRQMAAGR